MALADAMGLIVLMLVLTSFRKAVLVGFLTGILGTTIPASVVESIFHIGGQTNAQGEMVNPTGWGLNIPTLPDSIIAAPQCGMIGGFSLFGSFQKIGFVSAALRTPVTSSPSPASVRARVRVSPRS